MTSARLPCPILLLSLFFLARLNPSLHGAPSHAADDQLAAEAAALAPAYVPDAAETRAADPAECIGLGSWSPVIPWTPHLPVTAAQLPDGRLLTFASNQRTSFPVGPEFTYAAAWNPATGEFTEVNNARHDMFCGGIALLPDGRVVVNGGRNTTVLSSVFDWRTNEWTALQNMNDGRWYNTSVALADGSVFTASGSGGTYTTERWQGDAGWRRLTNIDWVRIFNDPGYIKEWHPFLLNAPDGRLFHFGPTDTMHWVDPQGSGSLTSAGVAVPGEHYPKEGCWAMYDEGKILVAGGGESVQANAADGSTGTSTPTAYVVNLNGASPVAAPAAPMQNPRQFANAVVLPCGEVMVVGGNTSGLKFNDTGSVLTPELWNPRTGQWRTLAPMSVPRNYHSLALLLPDGRVWCGGSGLSGNSADHRDAQLFTPPCLYNPDGSLAVRPVISQAPATVGPGFRFSVQASPGLAKFAAIKMSSQTHSMNTDLRRLELPFTETTPGTYQLTARSNINVMTPGYWMLFGSNPQAVYSTARIVRMATSATPVFTPPADQISPQNSSVSLQLDVAAAGTVAYSASGLPPGLSVNTATGLISGTITAAPGVYPATATATIAGSPPLTAQFNWTVLLPNLGSGGLLREWWTGLPGVAVSDLTVNGAYPTNPSGSDQITAFETPSNWAEDHGQRLRGYLHAPASGLYRFWIAGADECRLLLSTDRNAANATIIARVPSATNAQEWNRHPEQASAAIPLVAGQAYYVEVIMKAGRGDDHLAVAWQIPGAAGASVIAGQHLSPYEPHLSPAAAWNMDEVFWTAAAGQVAESAGFFGLHGTAFNGATTTAAAPALGGNPGTCRAGLFNGVTQHVRIPWHAALHSPDFTVTAWARVDGGDGAWRSVLASRQNTAAGLAGYALYVGPDDRWKFHTGPAWTALNGPVASRQWTHLAATFRTTGTTGTARTGIRRLYVNGILVAEDIANCAAASAAPLIIGAAESPGPDSFFGAIDEVRLYQQPLSGGEVQKAMLLRRACNAPPVLTNPGNRSDALGGVVSLAVAATDAESDILTFSAAGLPEGLAISPASGIISGTATATGDFAVTLTVADAHNPPVSASFIWTIYRPLTLAPLHSLPQPSGAQASFVAEASGGLNPRYKWSFGDGTPETSYAATPGISHQFPAPGRYLVTLTATDDTGRIVTSSFRQAVHAPLTVRKPAASSAVIEAGSRLWVVNPDHASVSVFDAVTHSRLAEIPVGAGPRSLAAAPDGRIWVACSAADTVAIVNPVSLTIAQTISLPRGSKPWGLIFDPAAPQAWLALENGEALLRFNASGTQTAGVPAGPGLRHLSISADGTRIYASRFITPRLPGEETAAPLTEVNGVSHGGQVVVVDAAGLNVTRTIVLHHSDAPDTAVSGRGIPNYLGAAAITPDGLSAWVPSKQDNIKRGALRDGRQLTHDATVRPIASRIDLAGQAEDTGARIDFDNAGMPAAIAYDPWGMHAFVALESSRSVAVVDVWAKREILRFAAGRAPQGLAVSADGRTLYVQNFMDRTVSIHDISGIVEGAELPPPPPVVLACVSSEVLSAPVLMGKQLFYDARDNRLAFQEYMSCAACHNDGGQDGRVWDLTGAGEGLRNTISLNGHGGAVRQGPLHWSGNFDEVQDFEGQIRSLSGGLGLMADADFHSGTRSQPMGAPKAGISSDLDALAAYLESLVALPASAHRSPGGSLTTAGASGRRLFKQFNCASCHSGTEFTNSAPGVLRDIGSIKPSSGSRLNAPLTGLDVPTLRGLATTAPYLHDGSAATLEEAVAAHRSVTASAAQLADLTAYLRQIDSAEPQAPAPLQAVLTTSSATVDGPFPVSLQFSGSAAGLDASDLTVVNGTATGLSGSGPAYAFTVIPDAEGTVTVQLLAGRATDGEGDGNVASNVLTVAYSPPAETLEQWLANHGLSANAGSGNADGDAFTNLEEFAHQLPPLLAINGAEALELRIGTSIDAVVRLASHIQGVTVALEGISDLAASRPNGAGWTDVGIVPIFSPNPDGSRSATYANLAALPFLNGNSGFLRVRITSAAGAVVRSAPAGWIHRSLSGGSQTFGMPFAKTPRFTGRVVSNTTTAINAAEDVTVWFLPDRTYHVEALDGPAEGHRWTIAPGSSGGTLNVAAQGTRLLQNNLLQGSRIAVREAHTLGELFPPALFAAGSDPSNSDRILHLAASGHGESWVTHYLADLNGAGLGVHWLRTGGGLASADLTPVDPWQGFILQRHGGPVAVTLSGNVRTGKLACPLFPGHNLVGSAFAVAQSPADRLMTWDGSSFHGFTGSVDPARADLILLWAGDTPGAGEGYQTWWLLDGGIDPWRRWAASGDSALAPQDGAKLFRPGQAAFIRSAAGHPNWIVPPAWTP